MVSLTILSLGLMLLLLPLLRLEQLGSHHMPDGILGVHGLDFDLIHIQPAQIFGLAYAGDLLVGGCWQLDWSADAVPSPVAVSETHLIRCCPLFRNAPSHGAPSLVTEGVFSMKLMVTFGLVCILGINHRF